MLGSRHCHHKIVCLLAKTEMGSFVARVPKARLSTSLFLSSSRAPLSTLHPTPLPHTANNQLQQYLLFQSRQLQNTPSRSFIKREEPKPKVEEVRSRVMKVCAAFDKINADKLTDDSHFMNDLGLDSLDHVEVIMAIEDEFGIEIPDSDAEKLLKPSDITSYVADKKGAVE